MGGRDAVEDGKALGDQDTDRPAWLGVGGSRTHPRLGEHSPSIPTAPPPGVPTAHQTLF